MYSTTIILKRSSYFSLKLSVFFFFFFANITIFTSETQLIFFHVKLLEDLIETLRFLYLLFISSSPYIFQFYPLFLSIKPKDKNPSSPTLSVGDHPGLSYITI